MEEKVVLSELEAQPFETPSTKRGKAYPLGGSLWKKDLNTRINPDYKYIHVDGIEACTDFLKSITSGDITGFVLNSTFALIAASTDQICLYKHRNYINA